MIEHVVAQWHAYLSGELPGGLDALLDDDVVFYSPIVFTPQRGKAVTTLYLEAAGQTLPGEAPTNDAGGGGGEAAAAAAADDQLLGPSTGFRYTKQVLSGDTAVLEFETTIDG